VRFCGKLAVLGAALSLFSAPVVACLSAGGALTTEEEKECCRKMPEGCGDMEMPSSHSCCTATTVRQGNPYLATSRASIRVVQERPALLRLSEVSLLVSPVLHDSMYSNTHDPPESPPSTISILRI
jgi:hypothetical protein